MVRKPRARRSDVSHDPCCVCGLRDARGLVVVGLAGGAQVTLCGTHDLMYRRDGSTAQTAAALRAAYGERRGTERRAKGEGDELAERLTAAFTTERRSSERRAV